MTRLLSFLEVLFVASFWLQTRYSLLHLMGNWMSPLPTSDYLIPFLYLSDICFTLIIIVLLARKLREEKLLGEVRQILLFLGNFKSGSQNSSALEKNNSRKIPFWQRLLSFFRSPCVWFVLLILIAASSIISNGDGAWAWYRWMKLIEAGLVGGWVAIRWQSDGLARRMGGILLIGLGGESLLAIAEWAQQRSLGMQWLGEWHFQLLTPGIAKVVIKGHEYLRPMGTFAHPNILGALLALSLPIGLTWWETLNTQGGIIRASKWIWLSLTMVGIGLTFSRSAWLAGIFLVVWCGIGKWMRRDNTGRNANLLQGKRLNFLKILGLGIGIIGIIAVFPLGWERFSSLAGNDAQSLDLRLQLIGIGWHIASDHFWLGVGINSFVLQLMSYGPLYGSGIWIQPVHQVWLLVWDELGIVGLISLIGLIISIGGRLGLQIIHRWRNGKLLSEWQWAIVGVWLGVFGLSWIDHYFWTSQQAFLAVWGLGGATIALIEREATNRKLTNESTKLA